MTQESMPKGQLAAVICGTLLTVLLVAGLAYKFATNPVAPAEQPATPAVQTPSQAGPAADPSAGGPIIAQFTVEYSDSGATLRWAVGRATEASIDNGVGKVETIGTKDVNPSGRVTYTLTATGPGGSDKATAVVDIAAARAK
jgi:hypothetical protein